jgi:hypothetical protein
MTKQKIPDIEFKFFVFNEIKDLFDRGRIKINTDYQRGAIWKEKQKIALIESILNSYSIGVLVLFINDEKQYEILDGQQRLKTINDYLKDSPDVNSTEIPKYSELKRQTRTLLDAYCVYYLKLKSFDDETREEDIVQTFLRLQEGTPLNKAEKISAHRGEFKNTFTSARESHPLFARLGKEKRFRWRQLAAEMLLIELESDFKKKNIYDIDLKSLLKALSTMKKASHEKESRNISQI